MKFSVKNVHNLTSQEIAIKHIKKCHKFRVKRSKTCFVHSISKYKVQRYFANIVAIIHDLFDMTKNEELALSSVLQTFRTISL
jgi:hypothetical protein